MNPVKNSKAAWAIAACMCCLLITGIALAQNAPVFPAPPNQGQAGMAAPAGQLRWIDPGQNVYGSVSQGCAAWLQTLQQYAARAQGLPNTIAMTFTPLPENYVAVGNTLIANCNFLVNTPQGQQRSAIALIANCGSTTYTPTRSGCVPAGAAQAAAAMAGAPPSPAPAVAFPAYAAPAAGTFVYSNAAPMGSANSPTAAAHPSGTFRMGDMGFASYGCFRGGNLVLCDFDVAKQANMQINAVQLAPIFGLVDDSGRVFASHNAFYVGNDGSRFPVAFLSAKPVRMVVEFEGVGPQTAMVSLVNGQEQIQAVPIAPAAPGQPEGTIPVRATAAFLAAPAQAPPQVPAAQPQGTQAQAGQAPAKKGNALDKANQGIDKANETKAKAKSILDSLKSLTKK